MDSYFADLRNSTGALELVLRHDDALSKARRPRLREKSNMKKPSSCPNYDAPNCPARKASHEDFGDGGYGSVHTFRAVAGGGASKNNNTSSSSSSSSGSCALQDFYNEVAPGRLTSPGGRTTSSSRRTVGGGLRRNKDANAGWDSLMVPGSPTSSTTMTTTQDKNNRLRVRNHHNHSAAVGRNQQDRSILFQGMVTEVLQCHNDILGPSKDGDARAEHVKQQLTEYLKAVEGLVKHHDQEEKKEQQPQEEEQQQESLPEQQQQQEQQPEYEQPLQEPAVSESPLPTSPADFTGYRSMLTRSASVKKDARWSARPHHFMLMQQQKQQKSESALFPLKMTRLDL